MDDDDWASHRLEYDSPAARLAGDMASAEADLEDVVSALDRLKAVEDDELARAAWYTLAVSRYARLFSRGRRHRIDHLLYEVIAGGPPTARALHDDIMGYRNNHLAHILSDLDQAGVMVEVQTRPGQVRRRHQAWAGSAFAVSGPAVSHFRDLADALRQLVVMERDAALESVRQEIEDWPLERLLALPRARAEGEPPMAVNAWRSARRNKAPRGQRRR